MKQRAETTKRFPAKREDGTPQCRECGKERPPKALWRTWCSDECVEAYKVRAWPAHAAMRAHERDKGVCALCRVDTEKLSAWINKLPHPYEAQTRREWHGVLYGRRDRFTDANSHGAKLGRHRHRALTLLGRLWGVKLSINSHLCEIDHVVPVAEGGGGCGLENLRTLCRRCHRIESAALNNRLRNRPSKGVGRGF